MVYADVLPYLYDHIPNKLQTRIRIANPGNLDAFFTELRNIWLEVGGQVNIPTQPPYQASSQGVTLTEIEKLKSDLVSLQAQLNQSVQAHNETLEKMNIRAVRLGMPPDAPKDLTSLDNYINDELIKRLGVSNTNYAKLSKKYSKMVNAVKKLAQHKCSNCGKAGHNSRKCPRKKKSKSKKGKVNLATLNLDESSNNNSDASSDESSDSETSSEDSSNSEGDISVNITKAKKK
jgi:hypothetical protein